MISERWSNPDDEHLVHPNASHAARQLEAEGYTQHEPHELDDGEGVMLVAGHDGSMAPANYHRYGTEADANGQRDEHVFETFPGSNFSESFPYAVTMHEPRGDGERRSKLGIFRPSKPEHIRHGNNLYEKRAEQHAAL